MSYLYTGEKGVPHKKIIEKIGNKNYDLIECRCKWLDKNGQEQGDFFGACSYVNGVLTPLDGDSYSLDDLYIEWEEFVNNEKITLTIWKYGYLSDKWEAD